MLFMGRVDDLRGNDLGVYQQCTVGDSMELKDYAQALRERWRLFLACTLLGVLLASVITLMTPKTYEARTELFVAPQGGSSASELTQGSDFVLDRVKSYVQVIDSDVVLSAVIQDLGLDDGVADLSERVTATVLEETVVVVITVTSDTPEEAAEVADSVAAEFVDIVPSLEPSRADDTGIVKVTITDPARLPLGPVSPQPILNLALGLLVGLAAGIAGAVARATLDRRVKQERDVTVLTKAPILGHIPSDPDADAHPVIGDTTQRGLRAEALRQLRTNTEFLEVPTKERSFVVTSSIAGEGKSLTAVNLAIVLAELGKQVCFLEADLRRPSASQYLGLEGGVGLTHVLIGASSWQDMMQTWSPNLDVMFAGAIPPNPTDLLAGPAMDQLIGTLESEYDVLIVDAPPLLPVTDAAILAKRCTGAIVVVGFGSKAVNRQGLAEALGSLDTIGARILGLVLNRMPTRGQQGRPPAYYSYESRSASDSRTPSDGPKHLRSSSDPRTDSPTVHKS